MIRIIVSPWDVIAFALIIIGVVFLVYAWIDMKVREWLGSKRRKAQ